MAATAKTKKDVQNQSSRDRLWDELETRYSQERAESDKAYDQNKAAFTRGLVNRGMQRSSYGGQAAAGYDKEKINAQNKSYENQIAAYQTGLDALEQREAEERYRAQQLAVQSAQIAANKEIAEKQLEFNREQAALSQQNWEKQFEQTNANTTWSQNYQQQQADRAQQNTEWSQNYQQAESNRAQLNTEWNQRYQQSQANLAQANTEWSQNYQQAQANREQNRWEQEFAQQQKQADIAQKNTEWSQNFQQQQADIAQQNTEWNQAYQQAESNRAQLNTEWNQNYQQAQANLAQANTAWNQAFQQAESNREQLNTEWNKAFQQSQANLAQQNTEWSQNYQQQQANRSLDQWEKEFAYQQESDDQKIAYNYAMAMLQNGQRPSDDLLKRAGLSTADANTMLGEAASGSGPVITWRQAADAAAKAAGYTGRNDSRIAEDKKKAESAANTTSTGGIAGSISEAYSAVEDKDKKKTGGVAFKPTAGGANRFTSKVKD